MKVPSDYASWDKAKLVEFWGVTFFTSPNLAEKGKVARSRVKQRINAMTVAAPAAKKAVKEEVKTASSVSQEVKPDAEPSPAEAAPKAEEPSTPSVAERFRRNRKTYSPTGTQLPVTRKTVNIRKKTAAHGFMFLCSWC